MITLVGERNMFDVTIEDFDLLSDEEFEQLELTEAE